MTTQPRNQDGRRAAGLALCLLAVALAVFAQEETPAPRRQGTVTANALNVRARPAQHYERIGQFSRGDRVTVVDETEDWLQVQVPEDTRGWVAAKYVSPDGVITGHNVRVHAGPGLVFTSFAKLDEKTAVEIMGPPVDAWQQILVPETASGWVSRAYIRIDEPPEPPESIAAGEADDAPEAAADDQDRTGDAEVAIAAQGDQDAPEAQNQSESDWPVVDTSGLLQRETMVIPKPSAATTTDAPPTQTQASERIEDTGADTGETTVDSSATEQTDAAESDHGAAATADATTDADTEDEDTVTSADADAPDTPTDSLVGVRPEDVATLGTSSAIVETTPGLGPSPQPPQAMPTESTAAAADFADDGSAVARDGLDTQITAVEQSAAGSAAAADTPAPPANPLVMKSGILFSLKSQANEEATHVLGMKIGKTAYPVCYLKSSRVDLTEWERRAVRVYGREVRVPGWSKPVLDVYSIQIDMTQP